MKGVRFCGVGGRDSSRLRMLESCSKADRNPIISGIALFGRNLKLGGITFPSLTQLSSLAIVSTTTISQAQNPRNYSSVMPQASSNGARRRSQSSPFERDIQNSNPAAM